MTTSGEDRFRLTELGPPRTVGLNAAPSTLLLADREIVPFVGRRMERTDLAAWLKTDRRVGARLLTAPGGQGKTRLAVQAARDAQDEGWQILTALPRLGSFPLGEPASAGDLDRITTQHRLVIVDDADRWPLPDLLTLLDDPRLPQPTPPGKLRILLLARSAPFWSLLQKPLDAGDYAPMHHRLHHLDNGSDQRPTAYDAAVQAFSSPHRFNVDHRAVARPTSMQDEAFGLILLVQMAALAAVLARVDNTPAPTVRHLISDPDTLTRHLLGREAAHWTRRSQSPQVSQNPQAAPGTPAATMARAVFVGTFTADLPEGQATELFTRLGIGDPRSVLADYHRCYPCGRAEITLGPVLPDRLGEDFLAALMAEPGDLADPGGPSAPADPAPFPADLADLAGPAVPQMMRALFSPAAAASTSSPTAAPLTTLVEVALRWPHAANRYLFPAIAADPALALRGGGGTLVRLCDVPGVNSIIDIVSHVVEAALEAALDPGADLDLALGAAAVAQRILERARSSVDPTELTAALLKAAARLTAVDRSAEALANVEEAVGLLRALLPNGATAARDLISALTTLAAHHARNRDWRAADRIHDEILNVTNVLSTGFSRRELEDVRALSLERRASFMAELELFDEGYTHALQAVQIRRDLLDQADATKLALAESLELTGLVRLRQGTASVDPDGSVRVSPPFLRAAARLLEESFVLHSELAVPDAGHREKTLEQGSFLRSLLESAELPAAAERVTHILAQVQTMTTVGPPSG